MESNLEALLKQAAKFGPVALYYTNKKWQCFICGFSGKMSDTAFEAVKSALSIRASD